MPFWAGTGLAGLAPSAAIRAVPRGPWWFPAAWYRHLRTPVAEGGAGRPEAAAAWPGWLERLSAAEQGAGSGWDPSWSREEGVALFALAHLRRQAGLLAAACRAGTVPELGDPGDVLGTAVWCHPAVLRASPPAFAAAWQALPPDSRTAAPTPRPPS